MNTEDTSIESTEATATAERFALVHTRNEEDTKNLTENFDISKLGTTRTVTGLLADAQMALVRAAAKGTRIVSTGLPLDIAAKLGEVTIVRAWSGKTNEDGSKRAGGSQPPADFYAGKIVDPEAFALLKTSPVFAKAFGFGEEEEGSEAF